VLGIEVGTQRARGEMLFPQPRREFCDPQSRKPINTLPDVYQAIVGADLVPATGREQASG